MLAKGTICLNSPSLVIAKSKLLYHIPLHAIETQPTDLTVCTPQSFTSCLHSPPGSRMARYLSRMEVPNTCPARPGLSSCGHGYDGIRKNGITSSMTDIAVPPRLSAM
jgi:hypothetical protein